MTTVFGDESGKRGWLGIPEGAAVLRGGVANAIDGVGWRISGLLTPVNSGDCLMP